MDFKITETNKDEKSIIYESSVCRIDNLLKSSDISCLCTNRSCKARLRTDSAMSTIITIDLSHSHGERKWSLPGKFSHLYEFSLPGHYLENGSFDCIVCHSYHTLSRYAFFSNIIRPRIFASPLVIDMLKFPPLDEGNLKIMVYH